MNKVSEKHNDWLFRSTEKISSKYRSVDTLSFIYIIHNTLREPIDPSPKVSLKPTRHHIWKADFEEFDVGKLGPLNFKQKLKIPKMAEPRLLLYYYEYYGHLIFN